MVDYVGMTSKTTAPVEFDAKENIETWEITTESTVWVLVRDPREVSGYRKQMVGGRQGGSRRVHLTTESRRFNQEQVAYGNEGLDPFTNGMLVKVDETHVDDVDTTNHLNAKQLAALLDERDSDKFETLIEGIKSELILRRLAAIAETQATVGQLESLRELITKRYPIGGTQKTVREMIASNEVAGGEILS